jgi:hypothetical protein
LPYTYTTLYSLQQPRHTQQNTRGLTSVWVNLQHTIQKVDKHPQLRNRKRWEWFANCTFIVEFEWYWRVIISYTVSKGRTEFPKYCLHFLTLLQVLSTRTASDYDVPENRFCSAECGINYSFIREQLEDLKPLSTLIKSDPYRGTNTPNVRAKIPIQSKNHFRRNDCFGTIRLSFLRILALIRRRLGYSLAKITNEDTISKIADLHWHTFQSEAISIC